jgi:hypothetical protein
MTSQASSTHRVLLKLCCSLMIGGALVARSFAIRHLIVAIRVNAAQPNALKAMIDWYRAWIVGGGMLRQHRLGFQ